MTDAIELRNAKIYTALVQAQQSAQAVHKSSVNAFHHYKYSSAEAIIAEAREALSSAGLALLTTGWTPYAVGDSPGISVHYLLVHVSGESIQFSPCITAVVPDKGRPLDKAQATALTYSLGYFLRGLLLLPRVEEEVDQRDDRPKEDKAPAPEWDKLTVEFITKFAAANDDRALSTIAAEVHKAKPPKAARDKIAAAYNDAVKRLSTVGASA